jgi:hypothetical protein
MSAEFVSESSAQHGILVRERINLGLVLHHLCEEFANQRCEFDSDEDTDYAYFYIKCPWHSDDIDICVHASHVMVRMARMEEIPLGDSKSIRARSRRSNTLSPTEPCKLTIPGSSPSD